MRLFGDLLALPLAAGRRRFPLRSVASQAFLLLRFRPENHSQLALLNFKTVSFSGFGFKTVPNAGLRAELRAEVGYILGGWVHPVQLECTARLGAEEKI